MLVLKLFDSASLAFSEAIILLLILVNIELLAFSDSALLVLKLFESASLAASESALLVLKLFDVEVLPTVDNDALSDSEVAVLRIFDKLPDTLSLVEVDWLTKLFLSCAAELTKLEKLSISPVLKLSVEKNGWPFVPWYVLTEWSLSISPNFGAAVFWI